MTDTHPTPHSMQGFNLEMGFELLEWSPGFARTQVVLRPGLLNSQGIVHGGVYCSFLDFNCGLSGIFPETEDGARACITLSLTTNFLASAREGTLYGRAKRTGGGRSIFFAEAVIEDAAGTPLATASGTFKYSRRPAPIDG